MSSRHVSISVCVLLLTTFSLAANPPSFLAPKTFSVGHYGISNTVSVVAADFNGDGHLDLAVANQGTGSLGFRGFIAVLLGNGDGTFKPAVEYSAGGVPDFVTVGDFNKDGKIDLVVANSSSDDVSILLGNGDGSFQTHMDFGTVNGPLSLAVGDFNNDGNLDVAATDANFQMSARSNVAVLLGNGDGTLQPAVSSPAGGYIQSITAGDFNGDGLLDLAVANKTRSSLPGNLSILLGKGDGTFQSPMQFLLGYSLTFIQTADFNQDGILDIATDGRVLVLGNGDGTFGNPIAIPPFAQFAVGDFNGDGIPDVASVDSTYVTVYYGVGNGDFRTGPSYYAGGSDPLSLVLGDFNGDHLLDLAVGDKVDASVAVLLAQQKLDLPFLSVPVYSGTGPVVFADFNGDQRTDIASLGTSTNNDVLEILLGNGDGTLRAFLSQPLSNALQWQSIVTGDFNRDGIADLAIGARDNLGDHLPVLILLGNGDGTFTSGGSYEAGANTNFLSTGDFNHDGILDLATPGSVLLGKGDGTFSPAILNTSVFASASSFVVGDVNGDGNLDVVATCSSTLEVLLGKGDGTFQTPLSDDIGYQIYASTLADFNNDSKLDLALTVNYSPQFGLAAAGILPGNGDGTFQTSVYYPLGIEFGYSVAAADVNHDGRLDLTVVGNSSTLDPTGSILIFSGNGDGTLQAPITVHIGLPYEVAFADLNQDNKPDMVVVANGINVFVNTTK